jgi:PPOX class probable F420-dependent enzyme
MQPHRVSSPDRPWLPVMMLSLVVSQAPSVAVARCPSLVAMTNDEQKTTGLPSELRALIESGPLAHLTTLNADGTAQVSVIWIGLDGDDIVSGHLRRYAKVRNIERDPRVVLSFAAPREPGVLLNPYAVVRAQATVTPSDEAWSLLDRLTKVYLSPDAVFPAPPAPGFIVRYRAERIGGVGPWA